MRSGQRDDRIFHTSEGSTFAAVDKPEAGLTRLERTFSEFGPLGPPPAKPGRVEPSVPGGEETLRLGIEAIQDAIRKTRFEISAIHAMGLRDTQFNRATDELDAVLADTENATDSILSSAEQIDKLASALARELGSEHSVKIAEVQEYVVRIYEACNFQDISGQRISKVVGLLHFIESCVDTMTEIWGAGEGDEALSATAAQDENAALLNGPSRAGCAGTVSQEDIDSLFR